MRLSLLKPFLSGLATLELMQAVEELEVRGDAASLPWWEAPPFHGSDFASVLSAATAPKPDRLPAWSDEADESDEEPPVTYENALRAQSAWTPAVGLDRSAHSDAIEPETADREVAALHEPAPVRQRRSASVTVRLSEEENTQLKQRAAEAGLTLSAYLRSCTLEVETLRAEVKQALADLRSTPEEKSSAGEPHRWWQRMAGTRSWSAQA